jgi:hypothetical protein
MSELLYKDPSQEQNFVIVNAQVEGQQNPSNVNNVIMDKLISS